METLVMEKLFGGIYKNRRVLVTGHSGFKGSWLCRWLKMTGAEVYGYSLKPDTQPSHHEILKTDVHSCFADIRNKDTLNSAFAEFKPEIVFHLAAQPFVRYSYENPVETYETNVIGTLNVFEAVRRTSSVRAVINVTSDKCYENREWVWGYRENDPMGGYDPYSSSKGCSELLTSSYRNSFFNPDFYPEKHRVLLASCRAGNVIGGGDWGRDRLVPDIMRAAAKEETAIIRNPSATRPWQHVLEPLSGYLLVGQKLFQGEKQSAGGWNFGPSEEGHITVGEVTDKMRLVWENIRCETVKQTDSPHEANLLKLDCSKAAHRLSWKNVWNSEKTFEASAKWYKQFYEKGIVSTDKDIEAYVSDAEKMHLIWTMEKQ